jgi:hypothetical protein
MTEDDDRCAAMLAGLEMLRNGTALAVAVVPFMHHPAYFLSDYVWKIHRMVRAKMILLLAARSHYRFGPPLIHCMPDFTIILSVPLLIF